MSVNILSTYNETIKLIQVLKKTGFSYRYLTKILNVDVSTLSRWFRGERRSMNPDKLLKILTSILLENNRPILNNYYSDTHNGPPMHLFGIQEGEAHHIQIFRRAIRKMADILDTYNRTWIETATLIGLDNIKKKGLRNLYSKKLMNFVLACYRISMFKINYLYPDWKTKIQFLITIEMVSLDNYTRFLSELTGTNLI